MKLFEQSSNKAFENKERRKKVVCAARKWKSRLLKLNDTLEFVLINKTTMKKKVE